MNNLYDGGKPRLIMALQPNVPVDYSAFMSCLLAAELIPPASSTGLEMHSVNNAHLFWMHCQSFCFSLVEGDFRDESGRFASDQTHFEHFKHTNKCTVSGSHLIDTTPFFEASHMTPRTRELAFYQYKYAVCQPVQFLLRVLGWLVISV